MRVPKALSPTSVRKFFENRQDFYLQYLSENKNPRPPQPDYMSVGAGVDACVKSQICYDVFGTTKGTEFEFEKLFETQVEAHARDFTLPRCKDIWYQYVECGAYASLRDDVLGSPQEPEMEFRVVRTVGGVPMIGYPDLRYIDRRDIHVVCDFKVNGSTSKTGASPFQGYKVARDCYGSNTHGKSHKKYEPLDFNGLEINATSLDEVCDYWADQLSTYSWLLGEEVGSQDFVVRMEQFAMRKVKSRELPRGKFVTHLNRISASYQNEVLEQYRLAWRLINSGHIFTALTREKSDELCETLDRSAETPKGMFGALHRDNDFAHFKG